MKKFITQSSVCILFSTAMLGMTHNAAAAGWNTFTNWFSAKSKPSSQADQSSENTQIQPQQVVVKVEENPLAEVPQWNQTKTTLPSAMLDMPYLHHIYLPDLLKTSKESPAFRFYLDHNHPNWLRISADGQYLEGNENVVQASQDEIEIGIEARNPKNNLTGVRQNLKISIDHQSPQPRWGIINLPDVAIRQKNYPNIDLKDFVTSSLNADQFTFTLTPGKLNPNWVSLTENGILHIDPLKISAEDINTLQLIEVTASSRLSKKSTPTELTIKVTPNLQLTGPIWDANFHLDDAVPDLGYNLNLAKAVNVSALAEDDQLLFQIVKTDADWLQIGPNGYSLIAKKVPPEAGDKNFDVLLRVSSRMSEKTQDFHAKLYVNPIPLALQWHDIPPASINQNYRLDLSQYITSNIRNDQFDFKIDLQHLPHWLSIQNQRVLVGVPQDANLLNQAQKISLKVKSKISGMVNTFSFIIPLQTDPDLAPQWKTHFLVDPIVNEIYRSNDLTTVLENVYPHDEYRFEYVSGPSWLTYNPLCHCIMSKGEIPNEAVGKNFPVQLRLHSLASAKSVDYQQELKVYAGVPQWTQTQLPNIKIAQLPEWRISLNNYVHDDISGDQFTYDLDRLHSPTWMDIIKENGQFFIKANSQAISPNEVGSTQTVRILATSQSTQKTSVQLLSIGVLANSDLAKPLWKNQPLPILTAGFIHAVDLNQYIQGSTPTDRLKITLGPASPSWLSLENNRLIAKPYSQQVGVLPPLNFIVHSMASNLETTIQAPLAVQLVLVEKNNMETHSFFENHQSVVIRGLKKNTKYKLKEVRGSHFDYGPFYSPSAIKSDEDWNANPFYAVSDDKMIETGEDGIVSIVYYSKPGDLPPQLHSIIVQ